jgi:hypothetical protein
MTHPDPRLLTRRLRGRPRRDPGRFLDELEMALASPARMGCGDSPRRNPMKGSKLLI